MTGPDQALSRVAFTVNGEPRVVRTHPDTPLLYVLRNELGLVGARFGCGLGSCGACFVLVDGAAVPSCDTPMWSVEGRAVTTVEGLAPEGGLHPVQQAVLDEQAAQCAYCITGVIMSGAALLRRRPRPEEAEVIEALERNLCRCGAHARMVRAVVRAGHASEGTSQPQVTVRSAFSTPSDREKCLLKPKRGSQVTSQPPRGARVAEPRAVLPRDLAANPVLSRWIRVGGDGVIDIRVGKVELGQGILTALAQLAADELDADLADVRMRPADTLSGPDEGVTAGSLSVSDCGPALRLAAACVRARFVAAASHRWGVDPAEILVVSGRITGPAGQETSYGQLAGEVDLDVAADPSVPVKAAEAQRLTGTDVPRLDLPEKVLGRPRFIHDLRLPGQWFARVLRPPSPGAHLIEVDAAVVDAAVVDAAVVDPAVVDPAVVDAAVAGPAVTLVRDGSFLAVTGPEEAEVVRAAAQVRSAATWSERDTLPDENDLDGFLRAGPHETIPVVDDGATVPPAAGRRLRATYRRPFLAHASMAPSCAVAVWHPDGRVEVWSHSQGIANLGRAIAAALDLGPGTVHVRHVEGAGCYGHNAADDVAFDAVLVARAMPGRPVQVVWSRSDELSWSPFGSAMVADVEATLDAAGRLSSWRYDVWSQGHTARPGYAGVPGLLAATTLARPATYPAPVDPPLANGAGSTRNALPGYELPDRRVTGHRLLATPIRSSAMRSLGAHLNVFAIESFMDEAALAAGVDPVQFRLAHLGDERGRRVLRMAADAAGWGSRLPDGTGRGIGYARYKGSGAWCAVVAEVQAENEVRVRRLAVAIDVGRVVNPDGVRNQVEGGAVQSTSWTLVERVRFDRRRITSVDWETYPILPFSRVPEVRVEIAPGDGNPSVGAGEAAQGPTAAAIGNALAAAAGVRVRDLPLTSEAVIQAIESSHDATDEVIGG